VSALAKPVNQRNLWLYARATSPTLSCSPTPTNPLSKKTKIKDSNCVDGELNNRRASIQAKLE